MRVDVKIDTPHTIKTLTASRTMSKTFMLSRSANRWQKSLHVTEQRKLVDEQNTHSKEQPEML